VRTGGLPANEPAPRGRPVSINSVLAVVIDPEHRVGSAAMLAEVRAGSCRIAAYKQKQRHRISD
jgi:hypothetical protein